MRGIDISGYQPADSPLVAAKLADPDYGFVISKATEGVGLDMSTYAAQRSRVKTAGRRFGAYHFAWPNQDPIAEAAHFVRVAALLPGEVPCLDVENWDSANKYAAMAGCDWPARLAYTLTWLREVKRLTGATAAVYMNWNWIKGFRTASTAAQWAELTAYPLWLADYDSRQPGVHPTVDPKVLGGPTFTVWMHQWTDNDGGLDGNFMADPSAWALAAVPSPTPPPPTPTPEEPPVPAIYWRGVRVGPCMVAPLNEVARLVTVRTKAAGVPDFYVKPIQGSFTTGTAASAKTHAGCAAIDIGTASLSAKQEAILEAVMREVGFASWNRKPSWWSAFYNKVIYGGWSSHNHSIRVGCKDTTGPSAEARSQIAEYVRGENGLVGGDLDTGTRAFVGRTWEAYLALKNAVVGVGGAVVDRERIKGIQRALRLTVDGKMGPQTYGAVWRLSKASRDGRKGFLSMSLDNRKALQRNIGCKYVDGGWIALGSEMPKRLRDAMGGFQSAMGMPIDRVWTDATEGKEFGALMARVGYRP